jgi:hypothetical protein
MPLHSWKNESGFVMRDTTWILFGEEEDASEIPFKRERERGRGRGRGRRKQFSWNCLHLNFETSERKRKKQEGNNTWK